MKTHPSRVDFSSRCHPERTLAKQGGVEGSAVAFRFLRFKSDHGSHPALSTNSFSHCSQAHPSPPHRSHPSASPTAAASKQPAIRFEDATAKSGIDFTHSFGSRQLGSLLEGTGGGCVWFDYDNDGKPDLYVVNGRPLDDSMHPYPLKEKPVPPPHNHLYRNDGNGHFTDVTDKAGLNPGHVLDRRDRGRLRQRRLYRSARDRLSAGPFSTTTTATATSLTSPQRRVSRSSGWAISSTWLDYDKDGCVDLFVGRYVKFDPNYRNYYAADNYPGPLDYEGETNKLFHNNCDGTFTDVSDKSGISALVGRTMGVTAADFDGDGWDDIYVANDRTENFLFHNKHDGTFEEVANDTGTAFGQNGESTSSMGPVFADFEGRGVLDLWVTDGHYNRLLRNQGKTGFEDMGASNGVSQTNAQYVSWGTGVYDFDNDGFLDILIFHGGLIHLIPAGAHAVPRRGQRESFLTSRAKPARCSACARRRAAHVLPTTKTTAKSVPSS